MAFISSFHGMTNLGHTRQVLEPRKPTTSMKFGMDKMLEKYDRMSRQTPQGATPSNPSSVWKSFSESMLNRIAPTRREMFSPKDSFSAMIESMITRSFLFKTPGGAPKGSKADDYMAACVTTQYKATACNGGIYGTACTEGTTRGMAEDARVLALGSQFRMSQRSTSAKFADFFSNRKRAIMATHECSYEESLVARFPRVAAAMITGLSEANGACVRYVNPTDPVEKYMVDCVDKQSKFRAVPGGLYGVMCQDGAVGGLAEYKRVQALAARYRAGQAGAIKLEDRKFAARKFARENYAGQCGYEEELFNKYPAVSMTMRFESVRY